MRLLIVVITLGTTPTLRHSSMAHSTWRYSPGERRTYSCVPSSPSRLNATLSSPTSLTSAAVSGPHALPLVTMFTLTPRPINVRAISGQSRRISGSPPPRVSQRHLRAASSWQSFWASSGVSSSSRGRPAREPQCRQFMLQARVSSQTHSLGK